MIKFIILFTLLATSVFAVQTDISITHDDSKTQIQQIIKSTTGNELITEVINYLKALRAGSRAGTMDVQVGQGASVAASGTFVFTGVPTAGETCVVAGQTFTALANASTITDAGAQFKLGTTAPTAATNLATAINAHSTIADFLTAASSSTSTVTITADVKGTIGNAIATTESLSNCTAGGALFTGGVDVTANSYNFGR